MRQELQNALTVAWRALGEPVEWWSGAERTAIAQETRAARACALCELRKATLLPGTIVGEHAASTNLPPAALEAIHRIVSDPGRLSEAWFCQVVDAGQVFDGGLSEEASSRAGEANSQIRAHRVID